MSGQTQYSPVKTSNLLDKCPMSGTDLQACIIILIIILVVLFWSYTLHLQLLTEIHSQH